MAMNFFFFGEGWGRGLSLFSPTPPLNPPLVTGWYPLYFGYCADIILIFFYWILDINKFGLKYF